MRLTAGRVVWLAVMLIGLAAGISWLVGRLSFQSSYQVTGPVYLSALSPDGRYLAYIKEEGPDVYVQDLQTGAEITAPLVSYERFEPSWTGGSSYLALRSRQGVTMFEPRTGESTRLDGVSFIYPTSTGPWVGVKDADGSISLRRIDRPEERRSLFAPGVEVLVITGDGPALGLRKSGETQTLVFVDRPGGSERVVASGFRRVYVSPNAGGWVSVHQDGSAYIGSPVGEARRVELGEQRFISAASWSPDGRRVLMIVRKAWAADEELLVLSAEGETQFRTTAPFRGDWTDGIYEEFWWSPDSRFLAFPTFVNPGPFYKKARVHVFDTETWQERRWKIFGDWSHQLGDFAWSNERLVLARLRDRLIRFELRS